MLKTEKYKFNIIETGDTFSPDALNANARAVETELARVEAKAAADKAELQAADAAEKAELKSAAAADKAELKSADAAIRASLGNGGKTCRIAWGSYTGNGQYGIEHPNSLTFDFKPHLIFIISFSTYLIIERGNTESLCSSGYRCTLTWRDNSVSWFQGQSYANQFNTAGVTYYYVAIGESL